MQGMLRWLRTSFLYRCKMHALIEAAVPPGRTRQCRLGAKPQTAQTAPGPLCPFFSSADRRAGQHTPTTATFCPPYHHRRSATLTSVISIPYMQRAALLRPTPPPWPQWPPATPHTPPIPFTAANSAGKCPYRADWEPAAPSGRHAPGCQAVLWGPSTPDPTPGFMKTPCFEKKTDRFFS